MNGKEEYSLPAPLITLAETEKIEIKRHLAHNGYQISKASRTLGITHKTLYNKIHAYGWNLKDLYVKRELYKCKMAQLEAAIAHKTRLLDEGIPTRDETLPTRMNRGFS